jgi:uncharacterized membrane protein YqaE (UPF0057 family)
MKQFTLSLIFVLMAGFVANAENTLVFAAANTQTAQEINSIDPQLMQMGMEKFLSLTPADYKAMTGKRLGVKNSIALKVAQHQLKQNLNPVSGADGDSGIDKSVYILLAILGLAWIAMGLNDDWSGSDWVVNLILTFLCWLPGLIHALVKMKKYYN